MLIMIAMAPLMIVVTTTVFVAMIMIMTLAVIVNHKSCSFFDYDRGCGSHGIFCCPDNENDSCKCKSHKRCRSHVTLAVGTVKAVALIDVLVAM